jgi:hypothetical protein
MRPGLWFFMTALLCCSSFAHGAPQLPGAHTEAPSMAYFERLTCDEDGLIQRKGPVAPLSSHNRAQRYDIITAPDRRSALFKGSSSTDAVAALLRCKDGRTTAVELHREHYRDPAVDASQIHPGLDQMGWFKFTPDGSRLVFAITGHARRPNPDPPPPYQSTLLVSKFIVFEVASSRTTTIDTTKWGFNSYSLSNSHIVFRGSEATYRADFEGNITRLTPTGSRDLWTPELSPDGRWVAEILADESYALTNVHDPKQQTTLAAGQEPWQIWNFNVFSPDSTLLAYGQYRNLSAQHSRDHTVNVYDIASKRGREVLSVRGAYTILMKLSPNNRELLVYSFWVQPSRSARLFCVELDKRRVSAAPYPFESGNLYVDAQWTTAEVAVNPGEGTPVPIDCASWQAVDTIVNAPKSPPRGPLRKGPPREPPLKEPPPPLRPPEPPTHPPRDRE